MKVRHNTSERRVACLPAMASSPDLPCMALALNMLSDAPLPRIGVHRSATILTSTRTQLQRCLQQTPKGDAKSGIPSTGPFILKTHAVLKKTFEVTTYAGLWQLGRYHVK